MTPATPPDQQDEQDEADRAELERINLRRRELPPPGFLPDRLEDCHGWS